jgi:hypothetical protein
MARLTEQDEREAMLAALQDECESLPDENHSHVEDPESSEAERSADAAQAPSLRVDGRPYGSPAQRPLTPQQQRFAELLIEGKAPKAAYREAYTNSSAADTTPSTPAAASTP